MASTPSKKSPAEGGEEQRSVRRKVGEAPRHGKNVVTVVVGEEDKQETYIVHEQLLKDHSEFFRKALQEGTWKESLERKVFLPDDKPEYFDILYYFLYTGRIYSSSDNDDKSLILDCSEVRRLCCSWVLGEKILSTTFKDALVDALIATITADETEWIQMAEVIYPASCSSSAIRKVLVDYSVWNWRDATVKRANLPEAPKEFLVDYALAMSKILETGRQGPSPLKDPECRFHEHVADDKPCYKTVSF